jgi:hypothetical protein
MFDQRIENVFGVSGCNVTFNMYEKRVHYYLVSHLCVTSVIKELAKR